MTREEEIVKEAELCASANTQIIGDWGEYYLGFIHGAEWADKNPINYDGKAMLYVNRKSHKNGYKEAVAKAASWLTLNAEKYVDDIDVLHESAMVGDFLEAMKRD